METTSPVMSITDEQIAEIEALANEAHIARSGHEWFSDADCCWWTGNADEGDFMAAASPKHILALIYRLRAAESEADEYFAKYRAEHARAESYRHMPSALLRSDQLLNECRQQLRAAERDAESAYLKGLVDQKKNFLAGWESTGIWDMCESKTSNGLRAMDTAIDTAMKGEQQ